jgi:HEAT repeat protein
MKTSGDGSVSRETHVPKRARRFQTDVRTLVVLVACCGLIFWASRHLTENADPVVNEVRALQRRAIEALASSKKPADRLTAIHELEGLPSAEVSISIPALVQALDDPDIEVRLAAVEALGSSGNGRENSQSAGPSIAAAAIALSRRVRDPNPRFRLAVLDNLGSIGASLVKSGSGGSAAATAAKALMECLNHPEPRVRSAAATSLGKIDSRKLAGITTPSFDRQALMDALARMLGDSEEGVRLSAINAVAAHPRQNGDPAEALMNGLEDESPRIRAAAITGMAHYRQGLDPWVPKLLRLAEHDPEPTVREQCCGTFSWAFHLPAITPAVVPDLIGGLKSRNARVRSVAAWILGELGADARAAVPELLGVLNEPVAPEVEPTWSPRYNLDPASAAARALGKIVPESAEQKNVIASLMEVVRNGPVSRRGWAAEALGEFGSAAAVAVPLLIKLLSDGAVDDKLERASLAASALGKIAPESPTADQAVAALLPALDSTSTSVRFWALEALGQFGAKAAAATPKIRALHNDRDVQVKRAASKALALIEDSQRPEAP